jgi:hypothetical protein
MTLGWDASGLSKGSVITRYPLLRYSNPALGTDGSARGFDARHFTTERYGDVHSACCARLNRSCRCCKAHQRTASWKDSACVRQRLTRSFGRRASEFPHPKTQTAQNDKGHHTWPRWHLAHAHVVMATSVLSCVSRDAIRCSKL